MSSYYLCEICEYKRQFWARAKKVDCDKGHDSAKVMFDHGHANGRKPYDEPLDVCADYEPRKR